MDAIEPDPSGPRPLPTRAEVRSSAERAWGLAIDLGTLAWRWAVLRNLLTFVAVVLSFVFVFLLPQTQHVLWQLPGSQGLSGAELLQAAGFYLFVMVLVAAYLFLLVSLIPAPASGAGWSASRLGSGGWERIDPHVPSPPTRSDRSGRFAEILIRAVLRVPRRNQVRLGWAGLAVGALAFLVTRGSVGTVGPALRTAGLLGGSYLAFLGVWMLLLRPSIGEGGAPDSPEVAARALGFKQNLFGRGLWYLLLTTSLGELLWTMAHAVPDLASFRIYTIWAVIHLVFLMMAVARIIDACHVYSRWNIRAMSALAALAMVVTLPSKQVGRFWAIAPRPTDEREGEATTQPSPPPYAFAAPVPVMPLPSPQMPMGFASAASPLPNQATSPVLPMDLTIEQTWFTAVRSRLDAIPPGPVYLVSASGGGSRAALFTSMVLEALRNTDAPEGFGESKLWGRVPFPAPSVEELNLARAKPRLADRILMISAVSGGSLASAYFLGQGFTHVRSVRGREVARTSTTPVLLQRTTRDHWQNAYAGDHYARMRRIALSRLDEARSGRSGRIGAMAGRGFLATIERVAEECVQLAAGKTPSRPIAPWLPTSAFVDDMSTDFMAPLLRGLMMPGIERGESVSRFWEDRFGWENVEDLDLHRQLDLDASPSQGTPLSLSNRAPVALFNACDVARGSRIILGFPPVPPRIITDPLVSTSANGPYSLTDRGDLYYHLSLAEAVRLSANFPWGFETATLPLRGGEESVLVLDGGIVDNSGIDSFTYLLEGLTRQADRYAELDKVGRAAEATYSERESYQLINDLRRRGVILIQIDSGTKDIKAGGTSVFSLLDQVAPALFRPVQALNNTSYTNADLAILGHDRSLGDALTPGSASFWTSGGPDPCRPSPTMPMVMPAAPSKTMPAPTGEAAPPAPGGDVVPPAPPAAPIAPPAPPVSGPQALAPGRGQALVSLASSRKPAALLSLMAPAPVTPLPPLFRRVRLTCNITENVMTAWALGPEDKAQVMVQFLIEWNNQRELVNKTYQHVHGLSHLYAQSYQGQAAALAPELWEDYRTFRTGQTLDDRARSEAYRAQSPGYAAPPPPQIFWPPQLPKETDPAFNRLNEYQSDIRPKTTLLQSPMVFPVPAK